MIRERMERLFVWLLIISIPLGTRTLLFDGANEYQRGFLYASDLLIGLLLITWATRFFYAHPSQKVTLTKRELRIMFPLIALLLWAIIAAVLSQDIPLGLYRAIKIGELLGLFWYFFFSFPRLHKDFVLALLVSALFQAALAISQFVMQGDAGLKILGEQVLGPAVAGVAKIDVWGGKFIRAYGTLPHPNVLGVFLVFNIFMLARQGWLWSHNMLRYISIAAIPLLTLALLLTFSRVALIVALAIFIVFFVVNGKKKQLVDRYAFMVVSLLVLGIIAWPLLLARFSSGASDGALASRLFYASSAIDMIRAHPFFGVGPGQFTAYQEPLIAASRLPSWANQPVHNIYLLLASETGLPALLFFLWFLIAFATNFLKGSGVSRWSLVVGFLAIGFFDHFFFTYQQGALLFWLTLGLASGKVGVRA